MLHSDALASIPRALTALVYKKRSLLTARKFVHAFFFSREVDLRSMLKFYDPKKALQDTIFKFGRERPVSRMLSETGRYSNSPVFVVGIYSGADKLGEGFGSSLKMAEFRVRPHATPLYYPISRPHRQQKTRSSDSTSPAPRTTCSSCRPRPSPPRRSTSLTATAPTPSTRKLITLRRTWASRRCCTRARGGAGSSFRTMCGSGWWRARDRVVTYCYVVANQLTARAHAVHYQKVL